MPNYWDEDVSLNDTGNYHVRKIRKRDDLNFRKIGFNVIHDMGRVHGTYRPIRNLPVAFTKGDYVDNEGWVWAQGKALGKYDRRIYSSGWKYQDATLKLGVSDVSTGQWYAYVSAETGAAVAIEFNDGYMGNGPDIDGFVGPMNGSAQDSNDQFSSLDVPYSILDPVTGNLVTATSVAGGHAATIREAIGGNFIMSGIAKSDTMRETRNNHYQYQRKITALTMVREGYVTLPFVICDASTLALADLDDATAAIDAAAYNASKQRLLTLDQTVLIVTQAAQLLSGNRVRIDAWGNPFLAGVDLGGGEDAGPYGINNYDSVYGTLVDFTHNVRTPYAKWVDTYPEMDITGTGTGGINGDVYHLIKKIETSYSRSTAIADLVALAENAGGWYGYATIYFEVA